jgi:serine kinase of HPr protein (carbohydrate metabolism regulator)
VSEVTVGALFERKREILALELLTPDCALDREIESPTLSSPGLALAGFPTATCGAAAGARRDRDPLPTLARR